MAGFGRLCELLLGSLSEVALRDCQVVLVEEGVAFGLKLLPRMRALSTLACGVRGG